MTHKQRKEKGMLYRYDDPTIWGKQTDYQDILYEYNQFKPSQLDEMHAYLKKMLGSVGENCHIEIPVRANWGGKNVHFGDNVYCNSNCTFVDDAEIFIGDCCMLAPNVTVVTAGHPVLPELRLRKYEYSIPVHIGKNVWIGAGAVILPGVTIGDNTVIGAGAVVTRDIPSDVVAVGNPCGVMRKIGARDKEFFFKDKEYDLAELD